MYTEKKICQEATINQLIKRKGVLVENINNSMTFVMGTVTKGRYSICGQKNCSCRNKTNPKLHGPYNDLRYRGGDKTGSIFLTEEKMPIAERLVQEYAEVRETLKEISCINLELFRRKEFEYLKT